MTYGPGPRRDRGFSTRRLEAFSDGVFAIAITLLVLEIAVREAGTPLEQVLGAWPAYVAYVVSFLTIGAAWISHTAITEELDHVDSIFLRLNVLLLLAVAFIPFPTRLVTEAFGDREAERVAVTFYGLTLLTVKLLGIVVDRYARHEALYSDSHPDDEVNSARDKSTMGVTAYVIAILVGLVLPGLAVAFYFAIAVYLIVPFRAVVSRRHGRM